MDFKRLNIDSPLQGGMDYKQQNIGSHLQGGMNYEYKMLVAPYRINGL